MMVSNPVAAKRAQQAAERLEAARAVTFDQCATEYVDGRPKWSQRYRDEWKATLERYVSPVIGSFPVSMVDTPLVIKVCGQIWHTKNRTESLVRDRIQAILDAATVEARRHGPNPARWEGHLDKLLAEKHKAENFAAMPFVQVPGFMAVLRDRSDTAARALEFCILTASRSDGVLGAKWSEMDLDGKLWTIPKKRMKARREHGVPLSARAVVILNEMAKRRENDAVFPGDRTPHLNAKAMRNLLCELLPQGQHATTHGFRSSFRTWAGEVTGFPSDVCERALAHKVGNATSGVYERGDQFLKRSKLTEAWAGYSIEPGALHCARCWS
jgi:integrase